MAQKKVYKVWISVEPVDATTGEPAGEDSDLLFGSTKTCRTERDAIRIAQTLHEFGQQL
jgi:hypothetical protein